MELKNAKQIAAELQGECLLKGDVAGERFWKSVCVTLLLGRTPKAGEVSSDPAALAGVDYAQHLAATYS